MKTTPSITYIYRMCHSGIHILFLLISYLQFWIMKHQSIDTWRKTSQECNTVLTSQNETLFWYFCFDITIWFVIHPFKCILLIPFSSQRSGFINFMNDEERRLFWQKSKSLFWLSENQKVWAFYLRFVVRSEPWGSFLVAQKQYEVMWHISSPPHVLSSRLPINSPTNE